MFEVVLCINENEINQHKKFNYIFQFFHCINEINQNKKLIMFVFFFDSHAVFVRNWGQL